MIPAFDLTRFKTAQASPDAGFDTAFRELSAGRKQSHWIWYVFPQLAGLGRSAASNHYGLQGTAEAAAYLRDPLLRMRLLAATTIVSSHLQREPVPSLDDLMGSPVDALKLVSCMTLFREIARRLNRVEPLFEYADLATQADIILTMAAGQGIPPCRATLAQLTAPGDSPR